MRGRLAGLRPTAPPSMGKKPVYQRVSARTLVRIRPGQEEPMPMPMARTIDAADGDDEQRGAHRDLEEAFAHPGDGEQLEGDDTAGDEQRFVDVGDQERQRVEDAAERGHAAGDGAAHDRGAAPGLLAGVRERLRPAHADPSAEGDGEADTQRCVRSLSRSRRRRSARARRRCRRSCRRARAARRAARSRARRRSPRGGSSVRAGRRAAGGLSRAWRS